jgi:hypothetical protein
VVETDILVNTDLNVEYERSFSHSKFSNEFERDSSIVSCSVVRFTPRLIVYPSEFADVTHEGGKRVRAAEAVGGVPRWYDSFHARSSETLGGSLRRPGSSM